MGVGFSNGLMMGRFNHVRPYRMVCVVFYPFDYFMKHKRLERCFGVKKEGVGEMTIGGEEHY